MTNIANIKSVITEDTAAYNAAIPVDARLKLSVYQVARTSYKSLNARIIHPHWAISHVVRGSVTCSASEDTCQADAGSVLIHPPNMKYVELAPLPGTHEWIVFDAFTEHNTELFEMYSLGPVIALRSPDSFSAVFESLLNIWGDVEQPRWKREAGVSRMVTDILYMLISDWEYAGANPRAVTAVSSVNRFSGLVRYLSENSQGKITRSELAARECLHPNSLDKLFRAMHGITPMRMLTRMRLSRARELLHTTDSTLETIAAECGFEDSGYFIRVFKSAYGTTPGRYRTAAPKSTNLYSRP